MGKLVYTSITSLDGYFEDAAGSFDWAEPDEELHQVYNDLDRDTGLALYGRQLYEVMRVWDSDEFRNDESPIVREYAEIWSKQAKIVFSSTLDDAPTSNTTLEPTLTPDRLRELKASTSGDISIGGGELAAEAIRAGLVDEIHQFVNPVIVGGGKRFLPDDVRLDLELITERRFGNGVVHLGYRVR